MSENKVHNVFLVKIIGMLSGAAVFVLLLALPTFSVFIDSVAAAFPDAAPADIAANAGAVQQVFALLGLMVIWWLTEAVPIAVTALVPAAAVPFLQIRYLGDSGLMHIVPSDVLTSYSNPIIFLFLGSFILAKAMQVHGLDRRITFWVLSVPRFSATPERLLFTIMTLTAFLSMWLSNTAMAAMIIPIGLQIVSSTKPLFDSKEQENLRKNFSIALILGIAWSASIGGIATIIGTPPNGIAVSMLREQLEINLTFVDWFIYGFPITVLLLPAAWRLLSWRLPYKGFSLGGSSTSFSESLRKLGSISAAEKATLVVFATTALAWILVPLIQKFCAGQPGLEQVAQVLQPVRTWVIALLAAVVLFVIPADWKNKTFLMNWKNAVQIDWGTLILFGGGLALSGLMFKTGAANVIAEQITVLLGTPSTILLIVVLVLALNFLTEITSNTAVASMMMPIVISVCIAVGADPQIVCIAIAIGVSLAFMLPVATPPNAIAFGTGKIDLYRMIRVGFSMNIISWIAVSIFMILISIIGG